jgi:hypothetical protein
LTSFDRIATFGLNMDAQRIGTFRGTVLIGAMVIGVLSVSVTTAWGLAGPLCIDSQDGSISTGADWNRTYSTLWEGVTANIIVRQGLVCDADSSPNNYSIADLAMFSGLGYGEAHAGHIRYWGGVPYALAKWRRDNADPLHLKVDTAFGSLPYGQAKHFWVEYYAWNGHYRMNVNSHVIQETSWNPFGYWSSPFYMRWQGQAGWKESDVPGITSAPTEFNNMGVQLESSDAWSNSLPDPTRRAGNNVLRYCDQEILSVRTYLLWTCA